MRHSWNVALVLPRCPYSHGSRVAYAARNRSRQILDLPCCIMNAFALTTSVLFGVAWQVPSALFGYNVSSIAESIAPGTILLNSTLYLFDPPTTIIVDHLSGTTTQGITTQVAVDMARNSDVTASENSTTQPVVDSIPPRITIDTSLASAQPPRETQEPETAGAPAATERPGASQASATATAAPAHLGLCMRGGHR